MKYIQQFTIILGVTLAGEALSFLLPIDLPASICGLVLMLALLCSGLIKVNSIRETASFLVAIMPVMFIPAAVALMDSFSALLPSLGAYAVITVVSTALVMAVSGRAAQAVIRRENRQKESD